MFQSAEVLDNEMAKLPVFVPVAPKVDLSVVELQIGDGDGSGELAAVFTLSLNMQTIAFKGEFSRPANSSITIDHRITA